MCVHTYRFTQHMCVPAYANMCAHAYVCTCICVYTHMRVRAYACTHICAYTHMCVSYCSWREKSVVSLAVISLSPSSIITHLSYVWVSASYLRAHIWRLNPCVCTHIYTNLTSYVYTRMTPNPICGSPAIFNNTSYVLYICVCKDAIETCRHIYTYVFVRCVRMP